jgi:hypothetical protein
MVGPQKIPFGEVALLFICQEHSLSNKSEKQISTSVLLFLELHLVFIFCLDLCSDLVISFLSRCILTSGPCWFSSKELFIKSLNGVGKEKKLYAKKVVQEGACVDCGLGFCISCLMSF